MKSINFYLGRIKDVRRSYLQKEMVITVTGCRVKDNYYPGLQLNLHINVCDVPWFIRKLMPSVFSLKKEAIDLINESADAVKEKP
jgi:hypothetical protein